MKLPNCLILIKHDTKRIILSNRKDNKEEKLVFNDYKLEK